MRNWLQFPAWIFFSRALSLLILVDLIAITPDFFRLFGEGGLVDRQLLTTTSDQLPLSIWRVIPQAYQGRYGSPILFGLFGVTVLFSLLPALFERCKWSYIALYFCFTILKQSIGLATYGVHEFMQIGLFYVALWAAFGHRLQAASVIAFAFRIHLSLAYFFAGISKMTGDQWWSGEAVWRSVNRDDASGFRLIDITPVGSMPWVFQIAAITTILGEALYFLANFRRFRLIFPVLMISMHLGTLLFQGLLIFGPTMIVLNVFFYLSASQVSLEADSSSDTELRTIPLPQSAE